MIFATDIQGVLHQLPDKPLAAVVGIATQPGSAADQLATALKLPLLQIDGRNLKPVRNGETGSTSGLLLFVDQSSARLDRIRLPGLRIRLRLQNSVAPQTTDHVLIVPNSHAWLGSARADLYRSTLAGLGIRAQVVAAAPNIADRLPPAAVIWNHALAADIPSLAQHAARTGAKVVHVNHSSHAFLSQTSGAWRKFLDACDSARKHSHVWCVSQSEMPDVTGCPRIRQVSCPVRLHQPRPYRYPFLPLRITLAGRCCPTKNMTNSLLAIARVKQLRPVELHVCSDPSPELTRTIELLNLQPTRCGQLPHEDWLQYLNAECDLLLQCSLTESYNMAATEAQQIGVPTIATATVHAADPQLIVQDPNNTQQIADAILKVANNHPHYALRAHSFGRRSADQRNLEYAAFVATLNKN